MKCHQRRSLSWFEQYDKVQVYEAILNQGFINCLLEFYALCMFVSIFSTVLKDWRAVSKQCCTSLIFLFILLSKKYKYINLSFKICMEDWKLVKISNVEFILHNSCSLTDWVSLLMAKNNAEKSVISKVCSK